MFLNPNKWMQIHGKQVAAAYSQLWWWNIFVSIQVMYTIVSCTPIGTFFQNFRRPFFRNNNKWTETACTTMKPTKSLLAMNPYFQVAKIISIIKFDSKQIGLCYFLNFKLTMPRNTVTTDTPKTQMVSWTIINEL